MVSSYSAKIQTTSTNSKPTFSGFTFADINDNTLVLTENDQLMVQSYSSLRVTCVAATAKNEASIAKYKVVIGSKTVESTTTVVDFGAIPSSGSVTITVSAVDSRGYSTTKTKKVTVLAYEDVKIDYWFIRRINEVEEATNFTFSGTYSPLTISGVAKNSLKDFSYQYTTSFELEVEVAAYSDSEIMDDENYDLLVTLLANVADVTGECQAATNAANSAAQFAEQAMNTA